MESVQFQDPALISNIPIQRYEFANYLTLIVSKVVVVVSSSIFLYHSIVIRLEFNTISSGSTAHVHRQNWQAILLLLLVRKYF